MCWKPRLPPLQTRHIWGMIAKIGSVGQSPRTPASTELPATAPPAAKLSATETTPKRPKEIGGPTGPEPTRYGDWEHNGRCIDF